MSPHQSAPQAEPLRESESEATAMNVEGLIAGLRDEDNRIAATRGIMIGTVLGIILWAVILWGLF